MAKFWICDYIKTAKGMLWDTWAHPPDSNGAMYGYIPIQLAYRYLYVQLCLS